jgi:hypothetical protein
MAQSSAAAAPHPPHSVGFNLGVIALLVALGGLGLAYGIDAAGRAAREAATDTHLVARTLGSTSLTIPASWLLEPADHGAGFARQVDLRVHLPLGPGGALRSVDVTLTQRSRVRPSASLLDGVYLHQFRPEQLSGPVGLVGKPMMPTEGYENETVWYDPIASSPFVAKCQSPLVAGGVGRCLRTVYLESGLAAVYQFDDDILPNWRRFDAEMHPLLNEIGAV